MRQVLKHISSDVFWKIITITNLLLLVPLYLLQFEISQSTMPRPDAYIYIKMGWWYLVLFFVLAVFSMPAYAYAKIKNVVNRKFFLIYGAGLGGVLCGLSFGVIVLLSGREVDPFSTFIVVAVYMVIGVLYMTIFSYFYFRSTKREDNQ